MTYKLHVGNSMAILPTLAAGSIQTCVTSPPYWGLRDYGDSGQFWTTVDYTVSLGGADLDVHVPPMTAPLGLESKPVEYIGHMVDIFRQVRRVLADDGTLWLNIGDTYCADHVQRWKPEHGGIHKGMGAASARNGRGRVHGMKPKDLVGIPWLLAFALRSDGWYLRSDIIWHKRNPMPESVTDRPTKGHEYVFLLAKSARYHCDMGALREHSTCTARPESSRVHVGTKSGKTGNHANGGNLGMNRPETGRNPRTVWSISSKPLKDAHFAVMPPELARRCIVAGARPGDTVLDPFAGACTVGKVAIEQGREFVGVELSQEYAKIGIERMDRARVKVGNVTKDDAKPGQQIGLFAQPE